MKSAFELALERSGGSLSEISDEKKKDLAAVDAKFKTKVAQAELAAEERLKKSGGDQTRAADVQADLVRELDSIRFKAEKEKEAIRNA